MFESKEEIEKINKKNMRKDKYFMLALAIFCFIPAIFYVIKLLTDNIPGYDGISITVVVILLVTLIFKIGVSIRNSLLIKENETNEIYVRDIPSKYSTAVISYLYNQKLEKKKDIVATILNLCSKDAISFKKDENGRVEFNDLNISNIYLTDDEEYIYNWITKKSKQNFNFFEWQKIVKNEYDKNKFSKKNNLCIEEILAYLFVIVFCLIFITLTIFGFEIFEKLNIKEYGFPILVIASSLLIIGVILNGIKSIFIKSSDENSIYTAKGANEIAKWEKFKKYMNDYTLIKDYKIESIVVLERYLAYSMVLDINKDYDELKFDNLDDILKLDFIKCIDNYVDNVFLDSTYDIQ